MKERIFTSLLTAIVLTSLQAQTPNGSNLKLVISLTVDQLRADYMESFSPLYGEKGFKRLLHEGYVFYNGQYDFIRLDESSSVATIHSGAVPYYNGIPGNQWMDRKTLRLVNSVDDKEFIGIYTSENTSAKNMAVSNISDELAIASGGKALIYSIAPLREVAVLAAGHAANGAFWINDESGKWCGTTYYGNFPQWVTQYNDRDGLDFRLRNMVWTPLLPVTSYRYVTSSNETLMFKHNFVDERTERYRKFKTSPFVNDEVNRLFAEFLNQSAIGRDDIPDFVSLSYYAGNYDHKTIGEMPVEIQDTYVRLDRSLESLLDLVEKKVGLRNTLFVITSTGTTDTESGISSNYHIPGGEFYMKRCSALLNMYLMAVYGQGQYVDTYYGQELYLNKKLIEEKKINYNELLERCADFIVQVGGVKAVYTSHSLLSGAWSPATGRIRNSYNSSCSGDIFVEVKPGWTVINEYNHKNYVVRDGAVPAPIIFYGANVRPNKSYSPVNMGVVAPTIAYSMRIRAPNASSELPLLEVFR